MREEIRRGVSYLKENDSVIASIIDEKGECGIRTSDTYFINLLGSIISQQLSVKAANSIYERLKEYCLSITPTNIKEIEIEELRKLGISYQKAEFLHNLADYFILEEPSILYFKGLTDEDVITNLCKIKGIGVWTAQMFLIFSLGRLDVLPLGDIGFKRSFAIQYGIGKEEDLESKIINAAQN